MPPPPIDPIGAAVYDIVSEMKELRKTLEETNHQLDKISAEAYKIYETLYSKRR